MARRPFRPSRFLSFPSRKSPFCPSRKFLAGIHLQGKSMCGRAGRRKDWMPDNKCRA